MANIGIITFHYAHNYGAVLQAYALQSYLEDIGHKVYIIDYRNKEIEQYHKIFTLQRFKFRSPITLLKKIYTYVFTLNDRRKRYDIFNKFIDSRFTLVQIDDMEHIDCFVLGSDQIWNNELTNGLDKTYWGAFDKDNAQKVISYAASMGILSTMSQHEIKQKITYLNQIDCVSVREQDACDMFQPHVNKKISVVLDPTLLINRKHWDAIAKKPSSAPDKYILLYMANKDVLNYAKVIAKEHDLEIVNLMAEISLMHGFNGLTKQTPEEFVWWFKNATYVLTTSFHGVAFSIIFERAFNLVPRGQSPNTRAYALLKDLGISDRVCDIGAQPQCTPLEYKGVNVKLSELKKHSASFIDDAI